MANHNPQETIGLEARQSRSQNEWYSTARQSDRDVLRMGWARHVLEEESNHPQSHSAARVRRAQNIIASLQNDLIG